MLSHLLRSCLVTLFCFSGGAHAQDTNQRHLTMIVNFPPGGGVDAVARILQASLSENLGRPIIIDNRGGAGGAIGASAVANAAPDGNTVLATVSTTITLNKFLQPSNDPTPMLIPVATLSDLPTVLVVNSKLPVSSIAELIDYSNRNPGKLSYASASVGQQAPMELLKQKAGLDMVQVPYKGAGPAMLGVVAGEVQVGLLSYVSALPHAANGSIRLIAAAERHRLPEQPDLPTIDEIVPGVISAGWIGIMAPRGTSPTFVTQLNAAITKSLSDPSIIQKLGQQGLHPMIMTSGQFEEMIANDTNYWAATVKTTGLTPK